MGFLRKELSYWLDIDILNTALVAYILHLKFKYDFTEMCLNGISIGFQGFNGVPIDYPSFNSKTSIYMFRVRYHKFDKISRHYLDFIQI